MFPRFTQFYSSINMTPFAKLSITILNDTNKKSIILFCNETFKGSKVDHIQHKVALEEKS